METRVYEVERTGEFEGRVERLTKKKRFFSLPVQIDELIEKFRRGEIAGELISHADKPFAHDVYKLRLPNPDANVGKSGGYRVIYIVISEVKIIVFLTIYYKKEDASLPDKYIRGLIDGCLLEYLPEEE